MTTTQDRVRAWHGPALFSYGFRPFFLGGALWASLAMVLWSAMLFGAAPLPIVLDPVSWHAHAFLFGYLGAAIAGFLLTAVPNWTGNLPIVGWSLAGLGAVWLAGRIAMSVSAYLPVMAVALVDLAFPTMLLLFLAREIVVGRNWKNVIVLVLYSVYLIANALFHWDAANGGYAAGGIGFRLGLAASLMLIAVIGGRVVPSFTRNWLVKAGQDRLPVPPMQGFDKVCLLGLLVALFAWVLTPDARVAGVLLLAAGLMHAALLWRWRGLASLGEPLVWVLHLAYAFLPLGAVFLGVAIMLAWFELQAASLHVWSIGAIGTMTLAIMTRASLGHTGAALKADTGTVLIYLSLPAALLCRLAAVLAPEPQVFYLGTAVFWVTGFLGFAVLYGPRLLLPRARSD